MESNSNCLSINIWERVQCLSRLSKILRNVKKIELTDLRKIKSVFVLSIAPRMLLEVLIIKKCDQLKHIIIDTGDHDSMGANNFGNVFPKLKELAVVGCVQLEYIFGHYTNDHQNHTKKHLCLLSLEYLNLHDLPSLVSICSKQYHTTLPLLKELILSAANIKSIGGFIPHYSRSVNCTTMKELSESMEDLHALKILELTNSNIENIFCVNEVNEQKMNLGLQNIKLESLNVMVSPFAGPKNFVSLLNLTKIRIFGCQKLQIIFSASILRCLPQLDEMTISDCEELKHIFEDDLENQNMSDSSSSTTCFPKLQVLFVEKCNKLKSVFPVAICNELPELMFLSISEAKELEEIFKSSEGVGIEKVKIPNLKLVATLGLPSLFQTQEIQFQAVEHRFIKGCDKLSLTSTLTSTTPWSHLRNIFDVILDFESSDHLENLFEVSSEKFRIYQEKESYERHMKWEEESKDELTFPQIKIKQTQETGQEFVENVVGLVTPSVAILPTNSEASMNEQSVHQQCPLEETNASVTHSQLEVSMSEKAVGAKNESYIQLVAPKQKAPLNEQIVDQKSSLEETYATVRASEINKDIEMSVEGGTLSSNAKKLTPSTSQCEKQYSHEYGNGQTAPQSFSISTKEPFALEFVDRGAKLETNQIKNLGDTSQIVEDLGYPLLVRRELEQLVSKKHLNDEILSLLTDFLVKHPSNFLMDALLTNRFKGYAYTCLADLLKFLQTHSLLDVLGSSHSEFVDLVQVVRNFPFNKDWLDGVEKRVLLPDFQFSLDAMQKLLDSKKKVIKEVEETRLKIYFFNQHAEDIKHQLTSSLISSEAVLANIIQQEQQLLETTTALSVPLGY
ncbi:unnamed protein product [Lathyrus sativus]|nr:unnamed protein product [Lathyrus sativus]